MARTPKPWFRKDRRCWFVTIAGTRHNLGPDKKEAQERFYALMRQPQSKKVAAQSLAGIADGFLDWVQQHRSPDTYAWYRYRIERFCQREPDLAATEVRPYHVQEWVDTYTHLSQTARRNYLRAVKRCLNWARQQGYIVENPLRDLVVPAAQRRETVISPEEYERMYQFITDESFAELCTVTYEVGCRPQEILRVEARHVDLKNERWVFPSDEAKGKRAPRVVYLTQNALEITEKRMQRFPGGKLFRNSCGKPWTPYATNAAFRRLQIRMGRAVATESDLAISDEELAEFVKTLQPMHTIKGVTLEKTPAELRQEARRKLRTKRLTALAPKYSLYALRHSWATRALQSGLDGLTVAVLMGHSDPSTLARVYQHLSHDPKHLLQQARKAAG